ncbi:hypothetical protein [Ornithinimicrobium avium]|uniref:Lipoprotein n=1 Tax=Ornithinimicrobium avium TaxID=2283195 RepID=A0A345NL18_9MICO|nr:hypothetical protein [Ornithinimicrobium avium]AXH95726.1 hypothetical protein DV701_05945 [Ornithinimicrobium avium]
MRKQTTARIWVLALACGLALAACDGGGTGPDTTTTAADTQEPSTGPDTTAGPTDDSAVSSEPVAAPIIPDEVVAELDAAVAAEDSPIASTASQTAGLPPGGTLDVLQLERTEDGGYLLRVRLSYEQETRLSADEHRSLSLDGEQTFVDGIRLVDDEADRYALPTVYSPMDDEQVDATERFRCLCSSLNGEIPPNGQILSALYGPLGQDADPQTLSVEVPGFEPIKDVPVSATTG